MKKNDTVWYACYGSNLSASRFRSYIKGTVNPANGIPEKGCTDKSLWTGEAFKTVRGQLYFAKSSKKWDYGGVAFFDPDGDDEIYLRLYRITKEQFAEVQKQEGDWYTERVDLGPAEDGNPIVSFTSPVRHQSNPPSDRYRAWIETALIEECGVPAETAKRYLDRAIEN
jgi:hypothetical protein